MEIRTGVDIIEVNRIKESIEQIEYSQKKNKNIAKKLIK
jgi:phosphopantetheinyl transferase (holo-ACP synthase)